MAINRNRGNGNFEQSKAKDFSANEGFDWGKSILLRRALAKKLAK